MGASESQPGEKLFTGAQVLVEQLEAAQVHRVFCVPGESYLDVLDQLWHRRDSIETVACRHESGAALMANAQARLTGTVGVAFVTRGPGATHAAIGIHTAAQDGAAMLLCIGQVPREFEDRHSFQEVDYQQLFGGMAKGVIEVRTADRMAERVSYALQLARAGRPGPVVVVLPEDVLAEKTRIGPTPLTAIPAPLPDAEQVAHAGELLAGAETPLFVVGGPTWTPESVALLQEIAETHEIPVATGFRRQDCFNNRSRCYAGVLGTRVAPELRTAVEEADVIVAIGTRLSTITTGGYRLISAPTPSQTIVHVADDPADLGRVIQPKIAITSGPLQFLKALDIPNLPAHRWRSRTARLNAHYRIDLEATVATPDELDMTAVMAEIRCQIDADAVIANGAGNFNYWCNSFYQFTEFRTQLGTTSGAMGYAIPAAIAAKLQSPDRPAIAFTGDGDFQMCSQELGTAAQHGISGLVVIVINNSGYGTIRAHQERRFPGHVMATELQNPDFVELARAFGAHACRVTHNREFPAALKAALAADRVALIELVTPDDIVSPDERLADIRPAAFNY